MYKKLLHIYSLTKRYYAYFLIFTFLLFIFSGHIPPDGDKYKIKTIVIDAGHGGRDPGAVGKISQEKNITLSVALKLGHTIDSLLGDVKVIFTRNTDEFVELYRRAQIANEKNADLFISIHANSSKKTTSIGTETFIMGLHKTEANLEVAKLENAVILKEDDYSKQYEGFDPNSPEGNIIFMLYQNTFLEQSLDFASKVQNQFRDRVNMEDRGVKQAGFLVLWKTAMPSVLVEIGFISNPEEEKFLVSEQGQEYIASALFRAFRDYKQKIENKAGELIPRFPNDTIIDDPDTLSEQPVLFRIQLTSSSIPIKLIPENFNGLKDVEEIKINGTYKYTVGKSQEYKDIQNLQGKIKKKYPDAFIIAMKGNKKIPLHEVIKK